MSAQGAAPEGGTSGHGYIDRQASSLPRVLPAHILRRLEAAGVTSLDDWCALGHRRYQIWGVTRRTVALLDALAREVPR